MIKNVLSKKLVIVVSALSITGLLLTGCSSSNKNTQANAATQNQNGQQNQQNGKNFGANSEERKKQMEDSVNSLVSDGTITKDQGTKVLAALTTSTQRPNGQQNNNNSNSQGNDNSNNQQNQNNQKSQQGPSNQNGQSKGNRGNFNPLNTLVSDGTITQAQADKIMEKVRASMPQRQNNSNNGAKNNNSTTNNNANNSTGS
ncbi:hypothetical protein JHL18_09955 [Clostridium sp. YIM B02505]|uniref:Lipoprotein n=1 Tax=Clostridium yunnanense TaxID=2800325 RepID=A0ABS1ENM8_9CLOT|nr:hypothetical protein [Clostridium yunnanense]MBK1810949.1 hypothetical protein [Clostridium yunnanense]